MSIKQFITTIISCFLLVLVNAQEKQEKYAAEGDIKYAEYSFSPAIDIYKKVIDKGFENKDLLQKLGNSYYFNADYKQAENIYERLLNNYGSEVGAEYYFKYGQTLRTLNKYEKADSILMKFTEMTQNDMRSEFLSNSRDYKKEIAENSGRYSLDTFNYNSEYSDFAPSFYKQGLIFSSDRDTGNVARYRHTWNAKDFLDIYKVNLDSSRVSAVTKMDVLNTRLHESSSVSTKDGKTIYFTRNNYVDGKIKRDIAGVIRLKIYKTVWKDSIWSEPEQLPFNSDNYSVAHPALSPDEKTLYFTSDMDQSIGESDIFKVSINENGSFGTPKNLGYPVNTESRETFPFVSEENILYFSSEGHPGLGGLDIFAIKILDNGYSEKVLNVGETVNSSWDDFSYIINDSTRRGYFASNRPEGLGADDIYEFLELVPLNFECIQPITGTVRDKITNEVLVGATVKIINEQNEEEQTTITDENGNYILSCDCNKGNFVRAQTQGYLPAEEYLPSSTGKPQIVDFYLEREIIKAGFGDDLAKLLQLSTIYFDFGKYNIRPDAEVEIQKVIVAMEKYPSLKIKANSHTDSRGKDSFNLWLSQKRAEATVAYMISQGIQADRLKGEGYGETRLVNQCDDGVRCSSEEHQLNRRSEFIILE
ncbi:OmpA family protein [Eudoraea sp.]|uniref:OmpA family protein n=3 Tax=Eudoraea sp. TaxID=1979955 RepID=UPI003C74C31D